ncbi:VOC family protein [Ferrimonas marina]|uniref:Catechol 2,3-dioxygenase n=1 Tax=Ferrimonas marina TaxID=299255 RepID=A0A1M5NPW7_9GAMM|nr:VOC family protein [Ferrimonas marina]SHG90993.1 Catechol 2,3-dioxygenase [Ferrimonas marina]
MFDHVVFGVTDYEQSKAFYLTALAPLGIKVLSEGEMGVELSTDGKSSLCIRRQPQANPSPLHIAFVAKHRDQVDSFHRLALQAGAKDNGGPGLRPDYSGRYYAAYVIGPDGHNIELVCHEEESQVNSQSG